ncbi:MAG: hypothetical protein WC564_01075 [Patescibacteria group bacterium]
MKNILNKKLLSITFFSVFLASVPSLVYGAIVTNTNPTSLDDGVQLMVTVAQWILGIVGSLALLMFVVGGFMFLISAGNSKTVETGKNIIIGAVVGLIIVFCSYMIIKFSMSALGLDWSGTTLTPTAFPIESVAPSLEPCAQQFGAQGFSCMIEVNGHDCKVGFCSGPANIKCCQANN